ncbi:MAG: hypothetical protein R2752_11140 [Vicinamibacterales bacterium]
MRRVATVGAAVAAMVLGLAGTARAQGDEIQVYDGGLAPRGVFNLTWHNNVTPKGVSTPAFPGAVVADKSWNGVPEWAYGVTDWFEAGLYLPLYSRDHAMGFALDGFKLRTLFARPDNDHHRFVYGANFEFSYNAKRWDTTRFTSEIRPIVGWHFDHVDLIVNPILDTAYDGLKNLEFAPSVRLAYNVSDAWAVAVEEYADYGPLRHFLPATEQSHQVYGVVDHAAKGLDIEAGIGVGLTDGSDRVTLKLLLSHDFNAPHVTRH